METRQKTEYKVYILNLDGMRGSSGNASPYAAFDDLDKLKAFYNSHLAEAPWTDEPSADTYGIVHGWNKVFKKGSPLEWYNPLSPVNQRGNSDIFAEASYHDAGFGGVTVEWWGIFPSQDVCKIPFNPTA